MLKDVDIDNIQVLLVKNFLKFLNFFIGYTEDDDYKIVIENDELLEKYNDIWNKFSNSIEKQLDCQAVYNKNCLKTKISS